MHYLAELSFCHITHKAMYNLTDIMHLYYKGQQCYLGSNCYFFWPEFNV
jgi:hypothetical protein